MRTPLLVVLTTVALFAGVVPFIESVPLAHAARASPQPSPKLRPSVAWGARAASPKTKRAPQPSPHPSPHPPQPSPGHRHHHGHGKRSEEDQDVLGGAGGIVVDQKNKKWRGEGQCPDALTACPVRGALDLDAFECVDLWADLSSCGGCPADDIVHDCAAIAHARVVECAAGQCEVRLCDEGYAIAPQHDACVLVRSAARDTTT